MVHLLGALQRGAASVLVSRELAASSLQVRSPRPVRRWPGRSASPRAAGLGWRDFIGLDAPFAAGADAAQGLAEVSAALGQHRAHACVIAVHGGQPHRHDRGQLPDRVDHPVVRPGGSLQPGQVLEVAAQGRFAADVQSDVLDDRHQPGFLDRAGRPTADAGDLAEADWADSLSDGVHPHTGRLSHGRPRPTPVP